MMLGRWICFGRTKKLLKIKEDMRISANKAIKLCEKFNVGL